MLTALVRRFCWLVSGILIGGEHRGHEKARLRKGVTILVATPGRLMDHLEVRDLLGFWSSAFQSLAQLKAWPSCAFEYILRRAGPSPACAKFTVSLLWVCFSWTIWHTHHAEGLPQLPLWVHVAPGCPLPACARSMVSISQCVLLLNLFAYCMQNTASFNTSNLSWLVLDEADRLLDLGFEAKLKAIIEKFDSRSSNGADDDSPSPNPSPSTHRRRTVLLSATLHPGLSVLAGLSLQDPVGVGFKAEVVDGQLQLAAEAGVDGQEQQQGGKTAGAGGEIAFELPQQLKQKYVEVDAKMRLVYLIGGWAGAAATLTLQHRVQSVLSACHMAASL